MDTVISKTTKKLRIPDVIDGCLLAFCMTSCCKSTKWIHQSANRAVHRAMAIMVVHRRHLLLHLRLVLVVLDHRLMSLGFSLVIVLVFRQLLTKLLVFLPEK